MEKTVYNGRFIQVKEYNLDNYTWEKAYLADSLVVFPTTEDGQIYMIVEARPHEQTKQRLKFVTGHIESNENILDCANRELQEEIGLKANKLEIIYHHKSSGTLNSNFYMIEASDLISNKIPNPDGEETILEIKKFTFEEVEKMIFKHEITWGLSCLGFLDLLNKKRASS